MNNRVDDIRAYWIAVNLVKGIGAVRFRKLLKFFEDPRQAWEASPEALLESGLTPKLVASFQSVRSTVNVSRLWSDICDSDIRVLTWLDEDYPKRLLEIQLPPPVLYLKGEITIEDGWSVGIVGTRRMTAYGLQITEEVAAYLARNGITIVSGLARGIDTVAHKAALSAGGRTLAVLGSGVDRIYPPENRSLAAKIAQQGSLVSDYPLGTPPEALNFPPRNRLISGLSLAVVIVEAGMKSGALITSSFAIDQGRDVFAVPGSILAPQSKGSNYLIQQGARPVLSPEDILEALNLAQLSDQRQARAVLPTTALEAQVLQAILDEPAHIDDIRLKVDLPIEQVSSTLALMELKGMVRQMGGMVFSAVREPQALYQVEEE